MDSALLPSIDGAVEGGAAADGTSGDGSPAPFASCGLTTNGWTVLAIVEARVTANRLMFATSGAGCEGDVPGQVHVIRTLCGSVAADLDVAALTDPAPLHTGPLAIGDERLLVLGAAGCLAYPRGSVYQVADNRPPTDWDRLAAMVAGSRDQ
jgi:hypothetical protein